MPAPREGPMLVDCISLLAQDGSCSPEDRKLLKDDELMGLFKAIVFNREFDRRMMMLQRQGRLGFYMTSTGEESTIYGVTSCLAGTDPVFMSYREIGCLLWRKVDLEIILNQLIGNRDDLCKGRQMPIHFCVRDHALPSISSPVGTQLPQACGYAYAAQMRKSGEVALAFLGEGTASEGDFHTALNFSGVYKVPAIFVIRNNGYAISTPESVQTAAKRLADRALGYGMPGIQVDGNDILAVVKVMGAAVKRAREGQGPTLIEAMSYRLGAHSTADDPSAYRSREETDAWQRVDNFLRLENHARWRGIYNKEEVDTWKQEANSAIDRAIAACESVPPPDINTMFDDIYYHRPPHIEEQRKRYLEEKYIYRRESLR